METGASLEQLGQDPASLVSMLRAYLRLGGEQVGNAEALVNRYGDAVQRFCDDNEIRATFSVLAGRVFDLAGDIETADDWFVCARGYALTIDAPGVLDEIDYYLRRSESDRQDAADFTWVHRPDKRSYESYVALSLDDA